MKFYTVQHIDAWRESKKKGYLEGNKEFAIDGFEKHYSWMMEQMHKKLSKYNGDYPVWLWSQKPDRKRVEQNYLEKDTKGVLLEAELDRADVLLSDFEAWHVVLNNGFFSISEEEYELWEQNKCNILKEESWERIFDLHLLESIGDWGSITELQGVTGKIDIDKINVIYEFVATGCIPEEDD
ncbi:DUF3841 domain-containing protein [Clostridium aciditolerans]|uniref:DUF3841 domain-containing protein n=1 Tax=Clostridium aciditolerans TaxID=339861 RepID=A0A934M889_9CLOT|nr:DUF3841 domain-containing protein [Clostridium aciditolerans]MBI6874651.1 DUF3841 domain-containing protein [Clostridium aciditolerans]